MFVGLDKYLKELLITLEGVMQSLFVKMKKLLMPSEKCPFPK